MAVAGEEKLVLDHIMNYGHFDEIRKKVLEQLRQSEELKKYAMQLMDDSNALQAADLQTAARDKLLKELRKEIEGPILNKASEAAWAVMDAPDGEVSRLINQKVHEAICSVYAEQRKLAAEGPAHPQQQPGQEQQQHGHWQQQAGGAAGGQQGGWDAGFGQGGYAGPYGQ